MAQGPSDTILLAIRITLRIRESKVRNPDPPDRRRFVLSECISCCSYYAVIFLSPKGRRTPTMNCDIISISIIHTQRLETKRSRLELRRNVFSQRVVSHWNAFPEYVVKGSKLNQSARSRIDRIKNGAPSVRYELFARQSTATATARFLGNIPIRCE